VQQRPPGPGHAQGCTPVGEQDQDRTALRPPPGRVVEVRRALQPGEVLGADLDHVRLAHQPVEPLAHHRRAVAQDLADRSFGEHRPDVGVDADERAAVGVQALDQPGDRVGPRRRPARDGADVQDAGPLGQDPGQLVVGPLPVGGPQDVEAVVGGAVGAQADDGEADRLRGVDEPGDVDPGELGVPAEVRGQRAGAEPGHEPHRRAQPAGGDGHVEGVAAGAGDVVGNRALGPGVDARDGQQIDHQLAQDSEDGGVGHGRTLAARVNRPPALAPTVHHLGR
jgi:hypothetical protein